MSTRSIRVLSSVAVLSCLCAATPAWAQAQPGNGTTAAKADDKLADAKAHYEAGLRLYEAEDYDAARVEFERAYALSPNYRILYNLGLVLKLKADYVGALKYFELYLEEGIDAPEARKREVESEIQQLKQIVARVSVTTNVPGAEVAVDDVPVGKTPLTKPILVNPGRRRISATKKGRIPASRVIDIASRDQESVVLELGEERQVIVLDKSRRYPWVGYAVTGALAIGAGITGYVALNASNTLAEERDLPNRTPERLETLSDRSATFGIIADVTTVAAIIAGGISLYYTIKWGREANDKTPPPTRTTWRLNPGGLSGTF